MNPSEETISTPRMDISELHEARQSKSRLQSQTPTSADSGAASQPATTLPIQRFQQLHRSHWQRSGGVNHRRQLIDQSMRSETLTIRVWLRLILSCGGKRLGAHDHIQAAWLLVSTATRRSQFWKSWTSHRRSEACRLPRFKLPWFLFAELFTGHSTALDQIFFAFLLNTCIGY
uniref:Uncharacterized protein n=1 Tax=Physcomitrium patens TaxID=3218 RepID=A9S394_PHYPA|nr:hypothetical protein PHYPA_000149 [Physcomitrium patens]